MPLKREDIPRPALKKESVDVPELGGEVQVRAMLLKDRLRLSTEVGYGRIAEILACTVVDGEGALVFDVDEWEIFGGENQAVAFKLFDIAARLSGMTPEEKKESEEKNAEAPS
jgi:hypothetical protein